MKPRIKSTICNIRKQKINQDKNLKIPKNKDSISSLWDNFKHSNICIRGVPEEEEQEIEKIMKENFLNLVKKIHIEI